MAKRRAKPADKDGPITGALHPELIAADVLAQMAAPYNPRVISDHDLKALAQSMLRFSVVEPVVCNRRTGRIVGGHQRVKAALTTSGSDAITELPVIWVDLCARDEVALNLALNRISGQWEDAALADVLAEYQAGGGDLALTGFEDVELERLLASGSDFEPVSFAGAGGTRLDRTDDVKCPECGHVFAGFSNKVKPDAVH